MRCVVCQKLTLRAICNHCKETFLKPQITKRGVGTLDVYSFYLYSQIEHLLLTKHTTIGFRVFKELASITFKPFIEEFFQNDKREIHIIGVDEKCGSGYSHVALLTHSMKGKGRKIHHAKLLSQSSIKYSGKSLQFRIENPRNFAYNGKKEIEAIIVDDIITTGTTLSEAKSILEANGVKVLFALTLANAKE